MKQPINDTLLSVRLPASVVRALDNYRREAEDLPTRPEALRRCLVAQLVASGYPIDRDS